MTKFGIKNPTASLNDLGIPKVKRAYWNLTQEVLVEESLKRGHGRMTSFGAIAVNTGPFTERSPQDRFIVKDKITEYQIDWNDLNQPFAPENFEKLAGELSYYLNDKDVFVQDVYSGADKKYRLNFRLIAEYPWSCQFTQNIFLNPSAEELLEFDPNWTILCAPGFFAIPKTHNTRQHNFTIIDFSRKMVLIGGTGYTGEIKKSIFTILNLHLPTSGNTLPMHCSANLGPEGDTAIFFGLSGTGKTTLSTNSNRQLIGDDEHGWSNEGIFNLEGGCYAKCLDLKVTNEPEVFRALKHPALIENISFFPGSRIPDFSNDSISPNSRVSYPLTNLSKVVLPPKGEHPKNIFFLTADAFGVLPIISRLTTAQAMYYFISGYNSQHSIKQDPKSDPEITFSACFGASFLPLSPTKYAEMLGQRIEQFNTNVWLINTGWIGKDDFGIQRVPLQYTRALIQEVLAGSLAKVPYETDPIFGLSFPMICPKIPFGILNPKNAWSNKLDYELKANELAEAFAQNFVQYEAKASKVIADAAPNYTAY